MSYNQEKYFKANIIDLLRDWSNKQRIILSIRNENFCVVNSFKNFFFMSVENKTKNFHTLVLVFPVCVTPGSLHEDYCLCSYLIEGNGWEARPTSKEETKRPKLRLEGP